MIVSWLAHEYSRRSVVPDRRPLTNPTPGWSPARCSPSSTFSPAPVAPSIAHAVRPEHPFELPRVLQVEVGCDPKKTPREWASRCCQCGEESDVVRRSIRVRPR